MKKILTFLFFTLFINPGYSQQFIDFNQGGIKEESYYSVIPYKNVGGFIIVETEINGKKYKFMVDTGAAACLSQNVFTELNSQNISKTKVFDSNGKTDSLIIAIVPNIKLGDLNFTDIPAMVLPSNTIFDCFKIDGIIGSNMIRNSIISFSSKDSTITICNSTQKLNLKKKESTRIILTKGQSNPIIGIKAKNKNSVREQILFDSGMTGLYQISLNHFNFFNKKKIFDHLIQSKGGGDIGIYGNGNDTVVYMGRIPEILINNTQFKNISIKTTSGSERIGAKLLDYGTVTVDYINKRFYFESFEKSYDLDNKEFPIDIMVENGKLLVATVWSDSLKDQIKRGDQILTVNGVTFENVEPCKMLTDSNYFKLTDNTVLSIKSTEGCQKTITISKEL
ncbi:aspartyl protease [Breznakibacter xylanolyticus]|uniref:Aspartyl protease n=1 Tax=Breznakibacter xylanolyticus TaxID=990 RepID=A0A2W7N495_9BACT|nr:aspartyl protease family protein [Breznakibacter xylanolyticus]PZX11684.1 aspartyl protease [Breznakibacter xylanolyticus]